VKNVLVTNGYISGEALGRVVDVIDAANVDWKGFTDEFYRKHCSADLQSVLDATVEMHKRGVHVEVTFLIIPETNDGEDEARRMARYLVDTMGPDVPLHLSRFYPQYKFSHLPPTPVETLLRAREIAKAEGVHYVYVGNVSGKGYEDTMCPKCGKAVIKRVGYSVTSWSLDASHHCKHCGEPIPVVGEREEHL
jgi:pyruvate formate lyase activating enzyme